MKELEFFKYQGTGNDFIFIDNREKHFDKKNRQLISFLCDRKFGIGADGIVLIENHVKHDFEMIYFNPDSSQSFCGNASRCAIHFASYLNMIHDEAEFLAIDGVHRGFIKGDLVHLAMAQVNQVKPVGPDFFINTGSPHHVAFVPALDQLDVYQEGHKIRYNQTYKNQGTNVNFVELLSGNEIYVRTYERGVENETLSCGTGVTASALAVSLKNYESPVKIKTRGGDLQVSFTRNENHQFTDIYLIGPAVQVFQGSIKV
ncbi:MAG: diaminopimelate epimerase [Candidatus Cyclobacteriaceae bacterium M3_2C_046]